MNEISCYLEKARGRESEQGALCFADYTKEAWDSERTESSARLGNGKKRGLKTSTYVFVPPRLSICYILLIILPSSNSTPAIMIRSSSMQYTQPQHLIAHPHPIHSNQREKRTTTSKRKHQRNFIPVPSSSASPQTTNTRSLPANHPPIQA